jgi:predicted amidohydrolase
MDGESIDYIGESQVIDPKGLVRLKLENREQIAEAEISLEELQKFRKKFPVWKDRDSFKADW